MVKPAEPPNPQISASSDEAALLGSYRSGDRGAANVLVERTYNGVYAALFRLTGGDPELAADLTQETYRRAWQALPRFEGRARLGTWLYRIAYTTFLNQLRRPRPVDLPADDRRLEPVDEAPDPEQSAASSAIDLRLRAEVLGLPEDLRFAVTARFWGDRPVSEIAAQEGVTTVAIRKRLNKAFGLLAEALREETR